MSGSGGQNFGVRLALDGAEAVEAGLRRIQATAQQSQGAIRETGESAGRALTVIESGTRLASSGLTKLGGDFAALAPVVDTAGGAVGRLVGALGSGAGLMGVLGGVGGLVAAAVAVYQNWGAVTNAVAGATDLLTGRIRAVRSELQSVYDLLNRLQGLAPQAASAAAQANIAQIDEQANPVRTRIAENERRLALAREGGTTGRVIARGGASGLVPTDEFGQSANRAVQDRLAQRSAADAEAIERELRADRAALADLETQRRRQQGIVAAAEENVGSVTNRPADPTPDRPARVGGGGGGGRGATERVNEALRDRDALVQRNLSADDRYRQGLERIADLNDRLIAQGDAPLPDETVQRETTRLMEEYERATRNAGDATRDVAEGTREWARAAQGVAKALSGAFEDLVFEGKDFNDVLKDLERNLLRIGNQTLLQPLFQQGFNALFGGGGQGAGAAGGGGGAAGIVASLAGSLFGGGGGNEIVNAGAGLLKTATSTMLFHEGGVVGAGGRAGPLVPAAAFAGAPRFHGGGTVGSIFGPDERPVIAKVGETIRTEAQEAALRRSGGGVTININGVRNPDEFRQNQSQVTASLARALGRSGRNR